MGKKRNISDPDIDYNSMSLKLIITLHAVLQNYLLTWFLPFSSFSKVIWWNLDICRNQILKLEIYELKSNWKSRLKHCSNLRIYQQRVWLMRKPLSLWINHAVANQTIPIHPIFSQRIVSSDGFDAMSSKVRNGQRQASLGGNCLVFIRKFFMYKFLCKCGYYAFMRNHFPKGFYGLVVQFYCLAIQIIIFLCLYSKIAYR